MTVQTWTGLRAMLAARSSTLEGGEVATTESADRNGDTVEAIAGERGATILGPRSAPLFPRRGARAAGRVKR